VIGFLESWTGLSLLGPQWLALVLAVPLVLWWRRRPGEPAVQFGPAALLGMSVASANTANAEGLHDVGAFPRSWRVSLSWLPRGLAVLGVLCAVFALARPVRRAQLPLHTDGIDILLCLDTSSSMMTNDLDRRRSRLEVARDAAAEFIRGRPHDRIGLIGFARFPDVRCPLTLDHDALKKILADVATVATDGAEDATGIGTAVARAAQVIEKSASKSKVVILLTDGEENVANAQAPGEIAPIHAAQLCENLGVRVYAIVVGVGRRTPAGTWVPLDSRPVERLAKRTGGAFYEARDAATTAAVYGQIDALERTRFDEPRYADEDQFLPFLVAAIALLLASRVLESTVFAVLP
jgi:Ca-activated chloride channel homolog